MSDVFVNLVFETESLTECESYHFGHSSDSESPVDQPPQPWDYRCTLLTFAGVSKSGPLLVWLAFHRVSYILNPKFILLSFLLCAYELN